MVKSIDRNWALLYFTQKLRVFDQLPDPVGIIFSKHIFFAPFAETVDVDFGALWPDTPRPIIGRTILFGIFGSRSGSGILNRLTGVFGKRFGLMVSIHHGAAVDEVQKIEGGRIIYNGKYLGFHAKIGIDTLVG